MRKLKTWIKKNLKCFPSFLTFLYKGKRLGIARMKYFCKQQSQSPINPATYHNEDFVPFTNKVFCSRQPQSFFLFLLMTQKHSFAVTHNCDVVNVITRRKYALQVRLRLHPLKNYNFHLYILRIFQMHKFSRKIVGKMLRRKNQFEIYVTCTL